MRRGRIFCKQLQHFLISILSLKGRWAPVTFTEKEASTQIDFMVHVRASSLTQSPHRWNGDYLVMKVTAKSTHTYIKKRLTKLRKTVDAPPFLPGNSLCWSLVTWYTRTHAWKTGGGTYYVIERKTKSISERLAHQDLELYLSKQLVGKDSCSMGGQLPLGFSDTRFFWPSNKNGLLFFAKNFTFQEGMWNKFNCLHISTHITLM